MTHPITLLQTALVTALNADTALTNALGGQYVFDAPPKSQKPPYVAIIRHDVLPRDVDGGTGYDHRVLVQCWHDQPSRKAVVEIAERVVTIATASLVPVELAVTHAQHDRTDTAIDSQTGQARAAIALRFLTEPV